MKSITVTDFSVGVRHYQVLGNAYLASGFFINQKNSLVHLQHQTNIQSNQFAQLGTSYNE